MLIKSLTISGYATGYMDMSNHPIPAPRPPRPKSAVSSGVGIVGLIGMISWMLIAHNAQAVAAFIGYTLPNPGPMDGPNSALMNVLWCGIPMVLWSIFVDKVHRNPSTGLDWTSPKPLSETLDFTITKLAGLWVTWFAIAAIYFIGRWYWFPPYDFAMGLFISWAPWLFAVSIPYIFWIDRYLKEPRDGCWHFGQFLMGQPGWDKAEIAHHARAWAVKGFFIAFMISIVPGGFRDVINTPIEAALASPVALAKWLITFMFVVDVCFATVGYVLTMKPLDSHIRTANPYLAGWLAALLCYPPFVMMGGDKPLNYHVNTAGEDGWAFWLAGNDSVLYVWGGLLVILTAIYAWATVAFGLRFSNLTHRGILTHGPYAWTKHPAYVAKNTYWWLATMPFLATTHDWKDMVRNTVLMCMVTGVYYWRAKTEEKHLMADPAYQDYATWMAEHGVLTSRLNRLLGKKRIAEPATVELT